MGERKTQLLLVSALFLYSFGVNAIPTGPAPAPGPTAPQWGRHYVLVHGAAHGAWCWYKVVSLLRSSGNNVTALDLTASGINLKSESDIQSIADYFRPLTNYMASLPPKKNVFLVGHSLGGFATTYIMEQFPHKLYAAIFVTALMPGSALNASIIYEKAITPAEQGLQPLDNRFIYGDGTNNPPTAVIYGPLFLRTYFHQLAPIEDYELELLLLRPQRVFTSSDISDVMVITPERYGTVPRVFIITEFDRILPTSFQLWMIENNPPDEVLQINGTDHMVMFTKPTELADALQSIASRYS